MRPHLLLASLAMVTGACARPAAAPLPPPGHEPGEEAAVLAAMDQYMHAITANDLKRMTAMQTPDGMTYRALVSDSGRIDIVGRPSSYWVDPSRDDDRVLRERYWSPTVLVRGGIAVVWAPYEFWVDNETSHCGIDTFSFVKQDGQWLVANLMWTVEPNACAELRPRDPSQVRPAS